MKDDIQTEIVSDKIVRKEKNVLNCGSESPNIGEFVYDQKEVTPTLLIQKDIVRLE